MTIPTERPKLIAIDLDGTLLSHDNRVSDRAKAAIWELESLGTKVVIATGRPLRSAKAILEDVRLTELAILFNGAGIYSLDQQKFLHSFSLTEQTIQDVLQHICKDFPEVLTGYESETSWGVDPIRYEEIKDYLKTQNYAAPKVGDIAKLTKNQSVMKLHFRHSTIDAISLSKSLENLPVYMTWHENILLEVMAENVNKKAAVAKIATDLGIAQSETAAFGDAHNDMQMLSWVGYSVAMDNGDPEVKAMADFVTSSNLDDGVAEVLESWL